MRTKQLEVPDSFSWSAAGQESTLPNGIPRDLPLAALMLRAQGRLTIGVAAATNVHADGVYGLIRNIKIYGNHLIRGNETLRSLEAASAAYLSQYFSDTQLEYVDGGLKTAAGAVGNYDFSFTLLLPFYLPDIILGEQVRTLLNPLQYQTLNLALTWGGGSDIVTPAGTTTTALTAYGSGSGVPSVTVERITPLLGQNNAGFNPALVRMLEQQITSGPIAGGTAVNQNLVQVPVGNSIHSLHLKTYELSATGVGAVTLYDGTLLSRDQLRLNNNLMRDTTWVKNQQYGYKFGRSLEVIPTGWNLFNFVEDQTLGDALMTANYARTGQRLELWGDVTGGLTNPAANLITIDVLPAPSLKAGA